jgi:hypothetical protein
VSIIGVEGVTAPAANAGLTATVSLGEHCEDVVESVTLYEYVEDPTGDATYDTKLADEIALAHVPSEYHW